MQKTSQDRSCVGSTFVLLSSTISINVCGPRFRRKVKVDMLIACVYTLVNSYLSKNLDECSDHLLQLLGES